MRSWNPSVTRVMASCDVEVTSAALMTRAALPTARRIRSTRSFSRSTFCVALERRICSSIADSEVVCLRLVYFSVLMSRRRSGSARSSGSRMTRSSSLPALCIRISSGPYGYSGVMKCTASSRCWPYTWSSSLYPKAKSCPFLEYRSLLVLMTSPERILNRRLETSEASMSTFLISSSMTCSSLVRYS